jgi:hypothetical protein
MALPLEEISQSFISDINWSQSRKLRCMNYHHDFSSKRNAYSDLLISFEQYVYAINTSSQSRLKKGDIVIIRAKDYTRQREFFYIGLILEKLEIPLSNWCENGGKMWKYNYTCQPITAILEYTAALHTEINGICEELGLKNFLFHTRFCSDKMIPIIRRLIDNGSITLNIPANAY